MTTTLQPAATALVSRPCIAPPPPANPDDWDEDTVPDAPPYIPAARLPAVLYTLEEIIADRDARKSAADTVRPGK